MPNKTLYLSDSELHLFDQAKATGVSMSALFVTCLEDYLAKKKASEADPEKMEKIRLRFWNENEEPSITKSFIGRWLVGNAQEGLRTEDSNRAWDAGAEWSVAQTKNGNIVVYVKHCNDGFAPIMEIHDSFADFKDATGERGEGSYPTDVIAEAAAALDMPYEIELDI